MCVNVVCAYVACVCVCVYMWHLCVRACGVVCVGACYVCVCVCEFMHACVCVYVQQLEIFERAVLVSEKMYSKFVL